MNKSLLAVNVLYFSLAAFAAIFVTAEAWHYGFFFTPFPAVLTFLCIMFIGASVVGTLYAVQGVTRCAALLAMVALWTFAAVAGSHFSSPHSICTMLVYFLPIVGMEIAALACCAQSQPMERLSARSINIIRVAALILPVPLAVYAALGSYVDSRIDHSQFAAGSTAVYINCERTLFGQKRAKAECCVYGQQPDQL